MTGCYLMQYAMLCFAFFFFVPVNQHGTQSDQQDSVQHFLAGAVARQTQHEGQPVVVTAAR